MSPELQLLLILAIIIAVSKFAGHLSQRYLNQPVVFGEILAGLLLGPTLLNIFGWPIFRPVDGHEGMLHEHVNALASIGVLLLMFVAGLETNLAQMRAVGRTAMWTAIFGVVFPLAFGVLAGRLFGLSFTESFFIGAVLTATSVSITAQTLMEIGRFKSKEGMTILGAAVIDDVLGIIVLSLVIALGASSMAGDTGHVSLATLITAPLGGFVHLPQAEALLQVAIVIVLMGCFFLLAIKVGARYVHRVLDWANRLNASHIIPASALVLIFLFAVGAEFFGQVAAITGAYIVGILIGQTRHAKHVEQSIHPFTYALFVPVFFMSIGLGADARQLLNGSLLFAVVIVVIAVLTKVVGCGLGARLTGFTTPEATRVGIGMISRGEVGLIVAQTGMLHGVIGGKEYAALVIMVLASTVVTPILLRLAFPRVPEVDTPVFESVVGIEQPDHDEV